MFNVDPAGYGYLSASFEEGQARDVSNQLLAQQALQARIITSDQYGVFLAMPRAEKTKFVAGIASDFVEKWKQAESRRREVFAQMNPRSFASGIFGEPVRDPKTGGWGTRDVRGILRPFTQATPTPTPTPTPLPPPQPSRLNKIVADIFRAFGAPSPLGWSATPKPTATPTSSPTPMPTPTPKPTAAVKTVLMKRPHDDLMEHIPSDEGPVRFRAGLYARALNLFAADRMPHRNARHTSEDRARIVFGCRMVKDTWP